MITEIDETAANLRLNLVASIVNRQSEIVNLGRIWLLCLLCLWLVGCTFPGGTKPVIKIGLIAPFEGELRAQGYQRLYGVKLALQEINLAGGVAGYKIELVALNDYADSHEATLQAAELVIDSDVRAVIGQWNAALFRQNHTIYHAAAVIAIDPTQFTTDDTLPTTFSADYHALSGTLPTQQGQQAYLATSHLINIIQTAVTQYGEPTREHLYIFNPTAVSP
jgi:ABC-type branched-subunit amino acid transport system substrate-binding protein